MSQIHHGSATTTAAIRRAIQNSQESLRVLARLLAGAVAFPMPLGRVRAEVS